jgi:hypothetical protein
LTTAQLDLAFTAPWLMAQHFPPIRYVVEGVIPEGLSLIVAPPKFGKSWLWPARAAPTRSG